MDVDELVAAASAVIVDLGAAFYFTPATIARGAELGLDVIGFYTLGRGGVLGDVEAPVIVSAFGYFHPATLAAIWDASRAIAEPRATAAAFMECNHEFGRTNFSGVAGLDAYCEAAEAIVGGIHPAGLALFAGLAAEPLPDDAPARAMHLASVLREYRGSVHLACVVAAGVAPKVAHYIRRPGVFEIFGYSPNDVPTVSDADRRGLRHADELTNRVVAAAYSVLDEQAGRALMAGLTNMSGALEAP